MGLFSSIGSMVNDMLGGTSSAKQANRYALQQAQVSNEYQKEFANNAHQWEVEDLKKAGLNPILSANTGGADTGGAGAMGTGYGSTNGNAMDLITTISGALKNGAESALNKAKTAEIFEGLPFISQEKKTKIANNAADTVLKEQQTKTSKAEEKNQKATAKYMDERARGFSESHSYSKSDGTTAGIDGKIFGKGIGIKGGHNSAKTHSSSRTY
ncbi:minor capsid protein [Capybara microvirus Cap3_SP_441]|nr:minor capsid protein [Capybara microvirus Cap3_SP_441]